MLEIIVTGILCQWSSSFVIFHNNETRGGRGVVLENELMTCVSVYTEPRATLIQNTGLFILWRTHFLRNFPSNTHTCMRGYPFLYSTDPAHDQNKLWHKNRMAGRHSELVTLHSVCVCVYVCAWVRAREKVVVLGAYPTTEEASRKSEPIVFLVHWVHCSLCLHNNDQRLLWTRVLLENLLCGYSSVVM